MRVLNRPACVPYQRVSLVALETELYDVLEVSSTATGGTPCGTFLLVHALTRGFHADEIKKAYRKKVLIFALFPSHVKS